MRIRSFAIQASNLAQAPRKIKLLINRPAIGFDDFSEGEAVQEFELTEEQLTEGKRIPLRFVRFQAVNALHVRCGRLHAPGIVLISGADFRGIEPRGRRANTHRCDRCLWSCRYVSRLRSHVWPAVTN